MAEITPVKGGEMGWILETNKAMNRAMKAMGGGDSQALPRVRAGLVRRPLTFAEMRGRLAHLCPSPPHCQSPRARSDRFRCWPNPARWSGPRPCRCRPRWWRPPAASCSAWPPSCWCGYCRRPRPAGTLRLGGRGTRRACRHRGLALVSRRHPPAEGPIATGARARRRARRSLPASRGGPRRCAAAPGGGAGAPPPRGRRARSGAGLGGWRAGPLPGGGALPRGCRRWPSSACASRSAPTMT